MIALPSMAYAVMMFIAITDAAVATNGTYQVSDRFILSPDDLGIEIKKEQLSSDSGRKQTTYLHLSPMPQWLFDRVQVGDTVHAGLVHYRIDQGSSRDTLYIPWDRLFPWIMVPFALALPMLTWLPQWHFRYPTTVLSIALAIPLIFFIWLCMGAIFSPKLLPALEAVGRVTTTADGSESSL